MPEHPEWADPTCSADISRLRVAGEGQDVEFKRQFGDNASGIAKEIAAFATSNDGILLIGVDDDGSLIGINQGHESSVRDELVTRIEGLCSNHIKPAITPAISFALVGEIVVMVVRIPKGPEPIYYSNHIPYVRHVTESRPAQPHEVVDLVRSHLSSPKDGDDPQAIRGTAFLSSLSYLIYRTLVMIDEAPDRMVNPWLDIWRHELADMSSSYRKLGMDDVANELAINESLFDLADQADSVAHENLAPGTPGDFSVSLSLLGEKAEAVREATLVRTPVDSEAIDTILDHVGQTATALAELVFRAPNLIDRGQVEDLQSEASMLGEPLTRFRYYPIPQFEGDAGTELGAIARELHLTETIRIYMDGGASAKRVAKHVADCGDKLNTFASRL